MKPKLLVLMLLLTAAALAPFPRAKADPLCPEPSCVEDNIACANNGGNPTLPVPTGETCFTLPGYATHNIAFAVCQYPNGYETSKECWY